MFHSLLFHFRSQSFAVFTKVPKCCCNVCLCGHCKQFKERQWSLFPRMLCCSGGSALSLSLWCFIADADAYSYSCFQLVFIFVLWGFAFLSASHSFLSATCLFFPRILFKCHKDARLHAQLPRRPAAPPKPRRSKKGVCQRSLSPRFHLRLVCWIHPHQLSASASGTLTKGDTNINVLSLAALALNPN